VIKRISHIGIAVADPGEAVRVFSNLLGCGPDSYEEVADQKVKTAIFGLEGGGLEILEAMSPDSPISKFIEKRGAGIHHICLEVDDIEAEIRRLEKAGMKLIDKTPRPGVGGALIAFIHPKSTAGILIELQQNPE
jgi:methylmalonyl-CoA/ethylmalonyl-CoA epimerase